MPARAANRPAERQNAKNTSPKLGQGRGYADTIRATRPNFRQRREEAIASADRTPAPEKLSEDSARDLLEREEDFVDKIERARQAREMGKRLRELHPPRIRDFPRFPGE